MAPALLKSALEFILNTIDVVIADADDFIEIFKSEKIKNFYFSAIIECTTE